MTKKPEDCASMAEVRAEIDRIDSEIAALMGERWSYVEQAWRLKSDPSEATVPWRIQEVIDRARARAEEQGWPPSLAEALWRQIIGWGIQYQEEKLGR